MNDRGIIKWAPFDSVISSSKIKQEIANQKKFVSKPILSEEQQLDNENNLFQAYHENININITYFQSNQIYNLSKKIVKIILVNQKIIFDDFTYIYFNQIINTSI